MYAGVKPVLLQHAVQALAVAYIDLMEGYLGPTQYLRYTFQALGAGVAQIVNHHSGVTRLVKFNNGVRAYEARTTCNQYIHSLVNVLLIGCPVGT